MNDKFPDPSQRLDKSSTQSQQKKGNKKDTTPIQKSEKSMNKEQKDDSESSCDSLIPEIYEQNFTREVKYMRGSPLPMKLTDILRQDAM